MGLPRIVIRSAMIDPRAAEESASAVVSTYTEKLDPHPQLFVLFGLMKLNP